MNDFMMQLAHASFQGGVIIAVIFTLRFLLKKAPKSILCLLWLLAITRLLLPIQLESSLSLQPDIEIITQQEYPQSEILSQTPSQQVPAVPMETIQIGDGEIINPIYSDSIITPEQPAVFDWASVLPWIWLSVAVGLALWSILSYLRLRNRTKSAIVLDEGIWLSPELDSAFVLGYLKPQIYLPAKLNKQEQTLVISHERAHIRRFDHWYKLLGFITLCVHWFNPLVWLAYIFLCRDMEMACDEQVVRDMDTQQRKAYSMALLRCSADSHHFKPCPVAFAEVSVKDRIKGVLNYKKPGFWMTLAGIVAVVFVAVCFLTSPADTNHSDDPAPPQTEAEYRQHCIDLMKQLRASEYQHILGAYDDGDGRTTVVEQIEMPGFHYFSQSIPEIDTPLGYYQTATLIAMDGEECYTLKILNPGDGAWVLTPIDEAPATGWGSRYLHEDLSAFETCPLEVYEFETGIRCEFTNLKAANGTHTMEFRFDPNGKLTSIIEKFTSFEGGTSVTNYDILWETDSHIQQLANDLLTEARKHAAYQQQLTELQSTLGETQISYTIEQHFEFRKRILLDGVTEIPEMDSALLSDELRHKKLVDADSLKRVDSEYLITEIILQDDGSADVLVTETVYYEIDDDTLWDPTMDEIIVHMIRLADVEGNCRVIKDAYREKYTNFNSRTFNAYPLEQAQKRIVTEAVAQYFTLKKDILCDGATVIPKMHPLRLNDKLAHKQALDDAGIQWIDSTYVIQEIELWDREYADVTLAETVTYIVNGETKQEVIQHHIGVVGVQFTAYVIDDRYFEPFSGFRSASYVDPSEIP